LGPNKAYMEEYVVASKEIRSHVNHVVNVFKDPFR
jgi:hypothetical protein